VTLPEECNLVKVTDFVHQNNNYQFQASELKLTVRGEPMTHEQRQKLITICPKATSQIQSLFNQSRRLTRYKITESGQMSKITLKGPMTKTEFETLIQILEPDTVIAEDKIPEPKTNDGKELKKMFEASQIYDEPFKPLFELGVMSTLKGMVLKFFEKMKNFAVTRGGMRNAVYAYLESENYAAKPVENTKSKLEELGSRPLGDFFKEICDIIFSQEESAALDGIVKADFGDSYHSFCWELYLYNKDPALVSSKKRREAINQVPGGAARQKHLINSAVNACTTLINT